MLPALPDAGEDINLTEADLNAYFDAADAFWGELRAQLGGPPREL